MAMRTEDMSKVSDSELLPEGWYHVRITEVKEEDDNGAPLVSKSSGNPIIWLKLKVQNEGDNFGRSINDYPSLLSHALFKLKAYYKATGYNPGPEGHDPQKLVDGECWIFVTAGSYQGKPTLDIKPYSIRSVQEGPGGAGGK